MNALIILFYRIVTFFTRVPAKTRALQTELRAEKLSGFNLRDTSYINYQSNLSDIPYGKGNLGLNGCGPIALFNALMALEQNTHNKNGLDGFAQIVDHLERKGAALKGKFGTAPQAINSYLKALGYKTGTILSKKATKVNLFSDNYDIFISLICNNSKSIRGGLHFIFTEKNGSLNKEDLSSFTSHNPEMTGSSLYETLNMCSNNEIRHVYTIGIKK